MKSEFYSLEEMCQRHAEVVLAGVNGNKSEAARVLKITRMTLYRILRASTKRVASGRFTLATKKRP